MISGFNGSGQMRALMVALAVAAAATAGAASAGGFGTPGVSNGQGDLVPVPAPTRKAPDRAPAQAEAVIKRDLGDPDSTAFRAVRAMVAESVRHGPLAQPIEGPVAVVCGQYKMQDRAVGDSRYYWFFVAIKQGHVLWTAVDMASSGFDEAYYSCKGAGLVSPSMTTLGDSGD
jgi:hypothetical protein